MDDPGQRADLEVGPRLDPRDIGLADAGTLGKFGMGYPPKPAKLGQPNGLRRLAPETREDQTDDPIERGLHVGIDLVGPGPIVIVPGSGDAETSIGTPLDHHRRQPLASPADVEEPRAPLVGRRIDVRREFGEPSDQIIPESFDLIQGLAPLTAQTVRPSAPGLERRTWPDNDRISMAPLAPINVLWALLRNRFRSSRPGTGSHAVHLGRSTSGRRPASWPGRTGWTVSRPRRR